MPPSRHDDGAGIVMSSDAPELTAELLRDWPLPEDAVGDKHDRGTVLVIAGTTRTVGAAVLAGTAALRAGAGRLQIATVEPSATSLAAAVPEALVQGLPATSDGAPDPETSALRLSRRIAEAAALLIGPGLEDMDATHELLVHVLPHVASETVVVLDAIAVRTWTTLGHELTDPLHGRLAFTPNRQEALALVPPASSGADDAEIASTASGEHGAAITVGGHIAAPDGRRWDGGALVPGLGTSGSGDVLAGLVAGCAARSGDAAQATCWGTYLHVEAGRSLSRRVGRTGYLARELLGEIPRLLDAASPR
jgi:hydroxyethylthiazole kinase-like uncharacterized protein yjeF